ncbi:Uncharacterised protein [uncultured archaeon]|nr:Uncharacterised protein [uncultured archaeon]
MDIKKKSMTNQRYVLVTIMTLILIMMSTGTTFAKVNLDQTKTIDLNKFYEIPMNEVKAGDVMNVDLQVTSGSPIDVLLMKSSDYPEYLNSVKQRGTINYLVNGSSLATTSIKYSYKFPENGDYYLVFDNTDVPKGGGSPTNQVEINLKVSVVTPAPTEQPKTSGFEAILAVFVIFVLIMWKK